MPVLIALIRSSTVIAMAIEAFHLAPPQGFRGIHPDMPLRRYCRNLPHWRQPGATYFVTFRLFDALPQAKLRSLKRCRELWELSHPAPRSEADWEAYARTYFTSIGGWSDEGHGECVFRNRELADVMTNALLYFQRQRYFISCFVVMPNHCHVLVCPMGDHALENILQSWKGFVGKEVNKRLSRRGALWQNESFDRIVRDEEHLFRVVRYIGNNPKMAGLPKCDWVRWIAPEWESAGWGFEEM